MKSHKGALPILFFVMFLVMAGFGIIIPILPFLAEDIGANPTELGLLLAAYSVMQLLFAPVWGKVSDRIGRKPVILLGVLGLGVSFFLTAVSTSLWMLFAARIIGGLLSAANMPTAMAYVADITTEENRGKGMGVIGAATGLGFVVGPAIGGIFSKVSMSFPFYLSGILCILNALLIIFFLKESLSKEDMAQAGQVERQSIFAAFTGALSIVYIMQLFISLSLAGLEATFAYFAAERAGMNTVQLGYIFMIMGLASAIVQGGLVGKLTRKFGEGLVIQGGIIISALGFFLILFIDNFFTAALYLSIFGVGNGIIRPAISSLLTKKTTTGIGSATGLLSSFDSLGRIIGPPLGGYLFTLSFNLPYLSGIILSLIAFILYRVYYLKSQQDRVALRG